MKDFSKYSAIIIGAGDATGSAITKKFASNGYKVCPVRRPKSLDKVNKLAEEINNSGGRMGDVRERAPREIAPFIYSRKRKNASSQLLTTFAQSAQQRRLALPSVLRLVIIYIITTTE